MVIDVHSILTTVGSVVVFLAIIGIVAVGFKNTSGKKGGSGNSGSSNNNNNNNNAS